VVIEQWPCGSELRSVLGTRAVAVSSESWSVPCTRGVGLC
jgi:hypothetical protein